MNRTTLSLALAAILGMTMTAVAGAADFATLTGHYEMVRNASIEGSVEGMTRHAGHIKMTAEAMQEASAAEAGLKADADAGAQLANVAAAATALGEAETLDAARDAFYEMSKALVQIREMADGDRPVVAYCPMVKRSWLQPDGPVGNPYAPNMLRCGEIVSK